MTPGIRQAAQVLFARNVARFVKSLSLASMFFLQMSICFSCFLLSEPAEVVIL